MGLVEENESERWLAGAIGVIRNLPTGWQGTGERMRLMIAQACGHPHHHNVYGALVNKAIKAELIEPTGEHRHMETMRSHARKTPVYRRTSLARF